MLECWAFCAGRRELAHAVQRVSEAEQLSELIAVALGGRSPRRHRHELTGY